jgi:hypothetical protein
MMTAYGNPYKALFLKLLAHHWTPIGAPMRNLVNRANHLSARKHTDIIFYAYFDHGLHIQ